MKVKDLIILLQKCDPDWEVQAGTVVDYPIGVTEWYNDKTVHITSRRPMKTVWEDVAYKWHGLEK